MVKNWGYKRLGELTKLQAIEEMKHAEGIVERIIFLDGTPSVDVGLKPRLRSKVQEQVEANLKDERDAVCQYKKPRRSASETAAQGAMFDGMIRDEQHAEFLEVQMNAIQE